MIQRLFGAKVVRDGAQIGPGAPGNIPNRGTVIASKGKEVPGDGQQTVPHGVGGIHTFV